MAVDTLRQARPSAPTGTTARLAGLARANSSSCQAGAVTHGSQALVHFLGAELPLGLLKQLEKAHLISEDDHKKKADDVQKMTDDTIKDIEQVLKHKEQEIMQV